MMKFVISAFTFFVICGFSYGGDLSSSQSSRIDEEISKNKVLFACYSVLGYMDFGIDGNLSQDSANLRQKLGTDVRFTAMDKITNLHLPRDDGETMAYVTQLSNKLGNEMLIAQMKKGRESGIYNQELAEKLSESDLKFRVMYDAYMANHCESYAKKAVQW